MVSSRREVSEGMQRRSFPPFFRGGEGGGRSTPKAPGGRSVGTASPSGGRGRVFSRLVSVGLLAGAMALAPAWVSGCRDGSLSGDCVGGVVMDGVCEGKCSPDRCAYSDNTCVGNRCVLACDEHADCFVDGSQVCGPAKEDDTNADITICTSSGRPSGLGVSCPVGTECADWLSCPDGTGCRASQCGGVAEDCVLDTDACAGAEGCTTGKCSDGSACRVGCAESCTSWLACETKGEADATAYCTTRDCAADADCLPGYYCGITRDPHEVCGSDPKKGDGAPCGETPEPCKSPGEGGTTLFEGSICMLRRSCIKRGPAAPCATDLDCSWTLGQVCREAGGQRGCAQTCQLDEDCLPDTRCDLSPGAEPGALGACVPRFGAWIGSPESFCEPCLSDEDCGTKGSTWGCADLQAGMRGCFDWSYSTNCTSDADCPVSPSGKHGSCLDEGDGVTDKDPTYHKCYLPLDPAAGTPTCW